MICVSDETAPNCFSNSSNVSVTSASGTGCPSLNRRGRRISNRRDELLIRGRPLNDERDAFMGQERQGGFRHDHLTRGPALERESAGQEAQGTTLGGIICKTNANHGCIVASRSSPIKYVQVSVV